MIDYVELKNFRKHIEYRADFTTGINVFHAENEGGKTTILEGISYALFGARACRNSDYTTWGQPEGSAAVRVGFAGHTVSRSKKGAEVVADNGKVIVTGQTEVTKWAEKQLGTSSALAASLMFSGQGAVRGVLEKGGAEATRIIEGLAGIDEVDGLIEKLQAALPTGNTKFIQATVDSLQADLQDLSTINVSQMKDELAATKRGVTEAQAERESLHVKHNKLKDDLQAQKDALESWKRQQAERTLRLERADAAKSSLATARALLKDAKSTLDNTPELVDTTAIALEIAASDEVSQVLRLFHEFDTINYNGDRMEMSEAKVQAEFARLTLEIAALNDSRLGFGKQAAKLAAAITDGSCGFCGNDFSKVPEVVQKNAALQAQLDEVTAQDALAKDSLQSLTEQAAKFRDLPRQYKGSNLPLRRPELFEYVGEFVPPKVAIVSGALRPVPVDKDALQVRMAEAKEINKRFQDAKESVTRALAQVDGAEGTLTQRLEDVAALPQLSECLISEKDMQAAFDDMHFVSSCISEINKTLNEQVEFVNRQDKLIALHEQSVTQKEDELNKALVSLESITFNNQLLKDIRAAKPLLAKKVWDVVLTSVSHYAGKLRNEPTTVQNTLEGFQVNGKPVESYSGSALDVIGLAVRVALVKTFTPNAGFIVLDEPFSACSDTRQTTALGVLSGCGFGKVLLVTHEDVSETIADNLVTF